MDSNPTHPSGFVTFTSTVFEPAIWLLLNTPEPSSVHVTPVAPDTAICVDGSIVDPAVISTTNSNKSFGAVLSQLVDIVPAKSFNSVID